MEATFAHDITVMPSQVDSRTQLSVADCFGLFMDAATLHAEQLGIGMSFLMQKGLFWLTVRTRVHFYRRPKMLETVEISTWPERPEGTHCNRQYAMAKGYEVLAVGRTQWAIMNMKTGRIESAEGIFPEGLDIPETPSCTRPFAHIDETFEAEPFATHLVTSADIDFGGHMNNVAYVRALMGAFSTKELNAMRLAEAEVVFRAPCFEGDVLYFQRRDSEGVTEVRAHLQDGRTALLARLTHGKRDER